MTANMRAAKARFQCALTQRPDKSAWTTNSPARTRMSSLRILNCLKSVSATKNRTAPVITSTTWDSDGENAIRFLLRRGPLNEPGARVQQLKVVSNGRIIGLTFIGLEEFPTRVRQVATQHVRVALVVENLRGLSHKSDGVNIGAIGEIEACKTVIGRRQADPGGGILRGLFGGVAEVTFGDAEIAPIEVLDPHAQGLVGAVILDVVGVLHLSRRRWTIGDNRHRDWSTIRG